MVSRRVGNGAIRPQPLSGVRSRLTSLRPGLRPTAQRIADFILEQSSDVIHMSVTELAESTNASEGSVIGLCKQLGATGFQQLKIVLAQELVQPVQLIHEDLEPEDDPAGIIDKIFASNTQALQDTLKVLDPKSLERVITAMVAAERIELYGIGSAAPIVEDAHYRMLRIGLNCKVVIDSHIQAISAALTGPKVVTLTVSHSGSTHETIAATRLAHEAGAKTVCITNYGKSPLLAHADEVLYTMARETSFRTEAMTSRIAQLAIVDALVAGLALRRYEQSVTTIRKTFEVLSIKRY